MNNSGILDKVFCSKLLEVSNMSMGRWKIHLRKRKRTKKELIEFFFFLFFNNETIKEAHRTSRFEIKMAFELSHDRKEVGVLSRNCKDFLKRQI